MEPNRDNEDFKEAGRNVKKGQKGPKKGQQGKRGSFQYRQQSKHK